MVSLRYLSVSFAIIAALSINLVLSQDFQNTTYVASFTSSADIGPLSVTTYFSPDTSIQTETNLVINAVSSIDIAIPSFSSWAYCSSTYNGVYGCTVKDQRTTETFPIFNALLNAIHRGVTVRILTNNYYSQNQTLTTGYIDPISFLAVAGAQVKYFTTLTFLHSKYMSIDGKIVSISSINYSKTSFMKNREAGVIVEGAPPIVDFTTSVFEYDWNMGIAWPTLTYSSSDMKIIKDKSNIDVVIPPATSFPGSFVTTAQTTTGDINALVFTSPDNAWDIVTSDIHNSKTLKVYIYQITNSDWCDLLGNYTGKLTILVSNKIFSYTDYLSALACYKHLNAAGITIRKTNANMYTYSHQKFWILDDDRVYVSTGNWGDTDYPSGSQTFPPYDQDPSQWRKTNRDFTIKMQDSGVTSIYSTLFDEDYERGYDWSP
ncbi:phospholipase D [Heterostelium album PN500]|uniref:Mitochondrial cardiolipin hydrolase n=1 Tax=Heterostelium pallidum (strain ATCC 26659 / Pp 5 / PN500) TaxID=670386 RepID=D3BSI0_HETP5|nr:phospholipase D [Heterostelium album PN500]EFA75638.1 phospholipase D [Heterostelium album PN500]|eukprot:XP_020427772.1 phospholipase D [Heterostelium album PN500]